MLDIRESLLSCLFHEDVRNIMLALDELFALYLSSICNNFFK